MFKLLDAGLQFGKLLRLDQSNLVSRYNSCLDAMNIPMTKLEAFHIDASGFSPEIAHELGDERYLDPHGVNKRFVIITPEQRKLPLLNVNFSADVSIIKEFYLKNDKSIRTITLKDAIYGEIENMVFEVDGIDDLVGMREVHFDVHTPSGILEKATSLAEHLKLFMTDDHAWKDDQFVGRMVDEAKVCGDIRNNGLIPETFDFPWPAVFRTSHFGGLYIFRQNEKVTVIGHPDVAETCTKSKIHEIRFIDMTNLDETFKFLRTEGYMEPLFPDWMIESELLERRLFLLTAMIISKHDPMFNPMKMLSDQYTNKWIHEYLDILKKDERFMAISQMRQIVMNDGDAAAFDETLPGRLRMMFRRGIPDHPDSWDVNRIILKSCKFDTIALYSLDKPIFYKYYETLDEKMKDFTVEYLKKNYHVDGPDIWRRKASFREKMFGIHQI